MIDPLAAVADAYRQVAHIAEWTGLSLGVLGVLAAVIYLDPLARRFAIGAAVIVVTIYFAVIYGDRVGARDVKAQWDAANAKIAAEIAERDKEAPIVADADSEIKSLRRQAQADMEQINALRKADAACHPITADELR